MQNCEEGANGLINASGIPRTCASANTLGDLLTVGFTIIGAIAFLMLIITGFRYVLSQGEPTKTADLRRQMIYIATGLILVVLANVIVTYIIGRTG